MDKNEIVSALEIRGAELLKQLSQYEEIHREYKQVTRALDALKDEGIYAKGQRGQPKEKVIVAKRRASGSTKKLEHPVGMLILRALVSGPSSAAAIAQRSNLKIDHVYSNLHSLKLRKQVIHDEAKKSYTLSSVGKAKIAEMV